MISTNELKKGTKILLKSGFGAILMDNKKGNIRLANVSGIFNEIGSIYAIDIESAFINNEWQLVTHSCRKGHAELINYLFN